MPRFFARPRVAVVELHGTIGGAIRSPVYERIFDGLKRSRRAGAVVLDIDSPGGSVPASYYLYQSAAKVAQVKPVVAFIRGVGASGAYLTSCAARSVVALPGSVIGSIGVMSIRPVAQELLQRLGVAVSVNKSGRLKDMGAFWRSPTPEEDQKVQSLIDEFYEIFVSIVAQARKLEADRVRGLATGEVFTATKAKEMGLIDELGGLERAIDLAAETAGIPRRPFYVRPRRGFRERFFGRFAEALVESVSDELERRLSVGLWRY